MIPCVDEISYYQNLHAIESIILNAFQHFDPARIPGLIFSIFFSARVLAIIIFGY